MNVVTNLLPRTVGEKHAILDGRGVTRRLKIGYMDDEKGEFVDLRKTERALSFPPVGYYIKDNVTLAPPAYIAFTDDEILLDQSFRISAQKRAKHLPPTLKKWTAAVGEHRAEEHITTNIEGTVLLAATHGSVGVWGHWLIQHLPRCAQFLKLFPKGRIAIPAHYLESSFYSAMKLMGIPEGCVVPLAKQYSYNIERAVFMDYLYDSNSVHPRAVQLLRAAIKKIKQGQDYIAARPAGRKIFIQRTNPLARAIVNRADIDAIAVDHGFQVVTLGSQPTMTQIKTWGEADAIVSVCGSDLTNLIFADGKTRVGSLTPSWFRDQFFTDIAGAFNLTWHELICQSKIDMEQKLNSTFFVDPERAVRFFQSFG